MSTRKFSDDQLLDLHRKGKTVMQMAKELGVNHSRITRRLALLGVSRVKRKEKAQVEAERQSVSDGKRLYNTAVEVFDLMRENLSNLDKIAKESDIENAQEMEQTNRLINSITNSGLWNDEEKQGIRRKLAQHLLMLEKQGKMKRTDQKIKAIIAQTPILNALSKLESFLTKYNSIRIFIDVMLEEIGKENEALRVRIYERISAIIGDYRKASLAPSSNRILGEGDKS